MQEIAEEMAGRAVVGKVYGSDRELFQQFKVRGIPAFFVVRNGEVKESLVGGRSKEVLKKALERHGSAS